MKKRTKILIATIICLILLVTVIPLGIAGYIYEQNFSTIYEPVEWIRRSVNEFEDLKAERITFKTDNGNELVGYIYSKTFEEYKGVIIISHGMGSQGQNGYMGLADVLTSDGFLVFAYDATGHGETLTEAMGGLPRGVIDLDYAIRYVKQESKFENLPIMLFGHSWGAYSVGNVINFHPDVEAVAMMAGFNESIDMLIYEGRVVVGSIVDVLAPYIEIYEKIKYGEYAGTSAIEGFDSTDASILIIHSEDDERIPYDAQYEMFYNKYKDSERFEFISFEDRGHGYILESDEARIYIEQFNIEFKEFTSLSGDELTEELILEYVGENFDAELYYGLDDVFMNQILDFYNSAIEE